MGKGRVPNDHDTTYLLDTGYIGIHPAGSGKGVVLLQHRLVAEEKLDRPLLDNEIVHHLDGDKTNNDPDNLEVLTRSKHNRRHVNLSNPMLMPTLSEETIFLALDMKTEGYSVAQIAKELSISGTHLSNIFCGSKRQGTVARWRDLHGKS